MKKENNTLGVIIGLTIGAGLVYLRTKELSKLTNNYSLKKKYIQVPFEYDENYEKVSDKEKVKTK